MVVADFLTPMSGQFSLSSNTLKTQQNPAGPDDLISGAKSSGAILPGLQIWNPGAIKSHWPGLDSIVKALVCLLCYQTVNYTFLIQVLQVYLKFSSKFLW